MGDDGSNARDRTVNRSGIACNRFRDQSLSVTKWAVSATIVDPTIHDPAPRAGERPPAIPKLMSPRQSPAMAHARDVASMRPSPLQITCVCLPAAIRASNASPVTPTTATKDRLSRYKSEFVLSQTLVRRAPLGGARFMLDGSTLKQC
jgi:hypothetical protein